MKRPTPQKAESSALNSVKFTPPTRFTGTDNPRYLRAIQALLTRPVPREQLDQIVGCANGPDLIFNLRELGLGKDNLPCERITFIDRDGKLCKPGIYSLTEKGRRMIYSWMARRNRNANQLGMSS